MKKYNHSIELIIQPGISAKNKAVAKSYSSSLKKAGISAQVINSQPEAKAKKPGSKSALQPDGNTILKTNAKDTEINPWDLAHLSADAINAATYIEPNFMHEYTTQRKVEDKAGNLNAKSFGSGKVSDNYDVDWQPNQNIVWHLDAAFSQLQSARKAVANIDYNVCIGHLDTGYSQTHFAIPDHIKNNVYQRNFVKGENTNDAHDPLSGGFLKQPGHGTGTLGLLAGGMVDLATQNGRFKDYLGGAYFAEVISCRIAESVVLIKTNAFAEALNYLRDLSLAGRQVHVVSMSMGGAPSKIWADAVNDAYEAGITIVTAAGNNFAGLPTRHLVYPARFGRVIAACGVTYDMKPYWTKKIDEMQGCYGPPHLMEKALAAFTPNTPWASVESGTVRFSGAGTSSATPQIAAAAAIYYRKYNKQLDKLLPWQRVEAIRHALYTSARHKVNNKYDKDFKKYFGNGIIQAKDALDIPVGNDFKQTPKDEVPWFPILDTLFKRLPTAQESARLDMFNTELAQLVYSYPHLSALINNDRKPYESVSKAKWLQFKDAVIHHPETSVTLKKYLKSKPIK